MSYAIGEMDPQPILPASKRPAQYVRRPIALIALIAAFASLLAVNVVSAPAVAAQQATPTIGETARLLGYLWADGSFDNGVWDATGPSGGSEIIQRLVIDHGGTWIDQADLVFTLPAPYDWEDWKDSLPNDDARTREAVLHPHFLAALLEGEGSIAGLVYDQSSCCTPGFLRGRLTSLQSMLRDRGFSTASITQFADAESGRVNIAPSEFAELRAGHEFVCPSVLNGIRVPGGQDFADHGPIRWFQGSSEFGDVVRTDCVIGQPITSVGPAVGDCVATSDGNGDIRVTWSYQQGTVTIRRNGTFVDAVSAVDKVYVDDAPAGSFSYVVRVNLDGRLSDGNCGVVATTDPFKPGPPVGAECGGEIVTLMGTGGADVLDGTTGVDVIHGYGGNDLIRGFGQDDIICGGFGDDRIRGGFGNDIIRASAGADRIDAGAGADVVFGGSGPDVIFGRRGPDTLRGEAGDDILRGGDGFDTNEGGTGADVLFGGPHIDSCAGGFGIDRILQDCETRID